MFNREEKLFYKTIEQIFSIEYDKRAKSEKNIRNWLEETYGSIIEASSKFSIQEENPTNIREYCLFLIRICCEKKYLKNWNQLELKKKDDIKSNCLILLGDPKEEIFINFLFLNFNIFFFSFTIFYFFEICFTFFYIFFKIVFFIQF